MTRAEIVDWATGIYEDLEFGSVHQWLADNPGKKAAGYLPVYVPREVIAAAGMLPVGIHGGGDRLEIIRGDAYYQSYICHLPRSIVELVLSGRLDMLSAVLFPSTCDVIRNLSGMWKMMREDTYVRYVDVPQVLDHDVGLDFWEDEIRVMLRDLAEVSGVPVTDASLRETLATYNEVRQLIRAMYKARSERPWDLPTEELYVIMRAGEIVAPEVFIAKAKAYLAAIEAEPGRMRDNCRVVMTGSFCEQPPLGLIKTIERAGCYIVDDDLLQGNRMLSADVALDGDPVRNLARAFLETTEKNSVIYECEPDGKRRLMKERVDNARADGIIFAAASFCDPALLDRPMLRKGAEAHNIPCIAFKFSENTGQFQQFREQAGTFADSIKLWGGQ